MKIGSFDTDEKVFIVAEIGNNHEGDFQLAKKLIQLAAQAGADAVKFQTIEPELLVARSQEARIQQLKRFEFSPSQFQELSKLAQEHSIYFLSTPFSLGSVDLLNPLVPAFKIASGDNDFWPLIRKVAQTAKPLLISMGFGQHELAGRLVEFVRKIWEESHFEQPGLALLHCVVSYPTPPEEAFLLGIHRLKSSGVTVGYSDHVIGNHSALLAVAAGARIIEKHFTIDKKFSTFRDHQLSADPDDFRSLVEGIRNVEVQLGHSSLNKQNCEEKNEFAVRRSIAAGRLIPRGHHLMWNDLTWLRPRSGLAPGQESLVLGKAAVRDIPQGEALTSDMFV